MQHGCVLDRTMSKKSFAVGTGAIDAFRVADMLNGARIPRVGRSDKFFLCELSKTVGQSTPS